MLRCGRPITCTAAPVNFIQCTVVRSSHRNSYRRTQAPRLQLTGRVQPRLSCFTSGQLFVHKKLGYVGAVLSSWTTNCHECINNLAEASPRHVPRASLSNHRQCLLDVNPDVVISRSLQKGTCRMYTVAVDKRNFDLIEPRFQSNVVYLRHGKDGESELVNAAQCRLDYVEHEDIIPILLLNKRGCDKPVVESILDDTPPLLSVHQHGIVNGFTPHHIVPTKDLSYWLADRPKSALQSTTLRWEITAGFKVSVMPFYLGKEQDGHHVWRYWFRIECIDACGVGPIGSATLHEQHLRMVQLENCDQHICSSAIDMPRFRPSSGEVSLFTTSDSLLHIYQGSGIVRLKKPDGYLWGWFRMEARDGVRFNCFIPRFPLSVPSRRGKGAKGS